MTGEVVTVDGGAALLVDPVSIRYASGFRSCALFQCHLPTAYLFVPAEGRP